MRSIGNCTRQVGKRVRQDPLLLVLVSGILLVRLVYLASYPFLIEGDGYAYYQLLQSSHSHLLHATGYVFFSVVPNSLAKLVVTEPADLLRFWQQLFSAASAVFLYVALRRVVLRWVALLVCGVIGTDTQMVFATGTTRPEFFQATLLVLLVGSAILGFTAHTRRSKTVFYVATGLLVVAGYLTKYNSLPTLVFALVPLLDGKLGWKLRVRMLSYSAASATVLFAVFLIGFHYPTTGSFYLNLEHGWIHILKLNEGNIPLEATNGIATQKYIILAEHLPRGSANPGPWNSLNEIPEQVRAPFREKWLALLNSSDPAYVRAVFDRLPPPGKRKSGYYEPSTPYSVYYHLGLEEGETLLGGVFWEGIETHQAQYLSNVWEWFYRSADFSSQYIPYLPVPRLYEPPGFFENSKSSFLSPRAGVIKALNWSELPPEVAVEIWYPGARVFSYLAFLKFIPKEFVWGAIVIGFLSVASSIVRSRRLQITELFFLLSLLVLLAEMSFSALIFAFRMKELILCQPLIYLLIGLSLSHLAVQFTSWRHPRSGTMREA